MSILSRRYNQAILLSQAILTFWGVASPVLAEGVQSNNFLVGLEGVLGDELTTLAFTSEGGGDLTAEVGVCFCLATNILLVFFVVFGPDVLAELTQLRLLTIPDFSVPTFLEHKDARSYTTHPLPMR